MRILGRLLLLLCSLSGLSASALAQQQRRTDAEQMGFAGEVKSVSTVAFTTDVKWQQPDGPTMVIPLWCWECEFDREGNTFKSERIFDASFHGEVIRIARDANGRVSERLAEDATTGATIRDEIVGPFGKTQEYFYRNGELQFVDSWFTSKTDRPTAKRQKKLRAQPPLGCCAL